MGRKCGKAGARQQKRNSPIDIHSSSPREFGVIIGQLFQKWQLVSM